MDKKVYQLLNDQINKELYSAYLYLDMSNYYYDNNLDGFGNWFKIQAQEERDHALLFMKYLQNNGLKVTLGAIDKPDKEFNSVLDPLVIAAEHERYVTSLINDIYHEAHQNKDYRVDTLLGDGELQEGQVWEACMLAAHYKLDNFCVIVDNNGLQIDGDISKVMSPYPIDEKLRAFGFDVTVVNGHDFDELEAAFEKAKTVKGQPSAILMKTTKGKDVSFMENNAGWHGKAPNDAEYEQAMNELKAILAGLEA